MRVHSVYVPNGRSLDSDQFPVKLAWLKRLRQYLDETCAPGEDVAVCGDFNVAPDDADVWDPAAFVGATHVSAPERDALDGVRSWGLVDVFRRMHPEGGSSAGGTTAPGPFIWATGCASTSCSRPTRSRSAARRPRSTATPRKKNATGDKPSDHTAVVVDFAERGAG